MQTAALHYTHGVCTIVICIQVNTKWLLEKKNVCWLPKQKNKHQACIHHLYIYIISI